MKDEELQLKAEKYFLIRQSIYGVVCVLIDYFIIIGFIFEEVFQQNIDIPSKLLICGVSSLMSTYLYALYNKQIIIDEYIKKYKNENN